MPRSKTNRRKNDPDRWSGSDLPDWISEELIQKTVEIWQPYYPDQLTRNDAIAIIKNAGGVIDCLRREK